MHYPWPNSLVMMFNYQLCRKTLNPDLHSGIFFLNYAWCEASSCMFCLRIQEKPQPSIPWVPFHVIISTSSLVPLLCGWELSVAQTGNVMSSCPSYSLSTSLSILVKLTWILSPCSVSEFDYFLLSSLPYPSYSSLNWVPAFWPGLFHSRWDSPLLLG